MGLLKWVLGAVLVARIALFVRDTGELSTLKSIGAHTGKCKKLYPKLRGFEDVAVYKGGEMIALSSNHSHFAFQFGATRPNRTARISAHTPAARSQASPCAR